MLLVVTLLSSAATCLFQYSTATKEHQFQIPPFGVQEQIMFQLLLCPILSFRARWSQEM